MTLLYTQKGQTVKNETQSAQRAAFTNLSPTQRHEYLPSCALYCGMRIQRRKSSSVGISFVLFKAWIFYLLAETFCLREICVRWFGCSHSFLSPCFRGGRNIDHESSHTWSLMPPNLGVQICEKIKWTWFIYSLSLLCWEYWVAMGRWNEATVLRSSGLPPWYRVIWLKMCISLLVYQYLPAFELRWKSKASEYEHVQGMKQP